MSETYGVAVVRTLVVNIYLKADNEEEALRKASLMDGVVAVKGIVDPPVIPKMNVKWPVVTK